MAVSLSEPPHCQASVLPAQSPPASRSTREACSNTSGTYSTCRYGNGRPSTEGTITGACAKTMDMTKPRKMACNSAS